MRERDREQIWKNVQHERKKKLDACEKTKDLKKCLAKIEKEEPREMVEMGRKNFSRPIYISKIIRYIKQAKTTVLTRFIYVMK